MTVFLRVRRIGENLGRSTSTSQSANSQAIARLLGPPGGGSKSTLASLCLRGALKAFPKAILRNLPVAFLIDRQTVQSCMNELRSVRIVLCFSAILTSLRCAAFPIEPVSLLGLLRE